MGGGVCSEITEQMVSVDRGRGRGRVGGGGGGGGGKGGGEGGEGRGGGGGGGTGAILVLYHWVRMGNGFRWGGTQVGRTKCSKAPKDSWAGKSLCF